MIQNNNSPLHYQSFTYNNHAKVIFSINFVFMIIKEIN